MIVALMMGALILMVFSQVVLRFLFDSSLVWVEELGRFIFMWLMFLGITVGVALQGRLAESGPEPRARSFRRFLRFPGQSRI